MFELEEDARPFLTRCPLFLVVARKENFDVAVMLDGDFSSDERPFLSIFFNFGERFVGEWRAVIFGSTLFSR